MIPTKTAFFITLSLPLFAGCSKGFQDPFATPKVGEKMSLTPTLVNQMPVAKPMSLAPGSAVVLKIGTTLDDYATKESALRSQDAGRKDKIYRIAVKTSSGEVFEKNWTDIEAVLDSKECAAKKSKLNELTSVYRSMTFVCSEDFSTALADAKILMVWLQDDLEPRELTSWGELKIDVAGTPVLIFSIII